MLLAAALIMCFYLMTTSFVTTLLIPQSNSPERRGPGRAIAYVAHEHLGNAFGTIYDISTITILWFAGASAMAGLLNVVPRYLPRYVARVGQGHQAAGTRLHGHLHDRHGDLRRRRGLAGGGYATGILAMMTSAGFAVTLTAWRGGRTPGTVSSGS